MDGRPGSLSPVLIMNSDGSWLGRSVYMERITQMSSMHSPTLENISLSSMPLCPNFLNSKGDFSRLPVLRSVLRLGVGIGWPLYLVSIGLGSKVSTWLGPPLRNRKITRLALGAKCGGRTSSGLPRVSSAAPRMPPKPSMPNPLPIVRSALRRVIDSFKNISRKAAKNAKENQENSSLRSLRLCATLLFAWSLNETEFVRAEQYLRVLRPGIFTLMQEL